MPDSQSAKIELKLAFADGVELDSLLVTPLEDNHYLAEESAISLGESEQIIRYGDVIEVERRSEHEGLFLRILQPSPYQMSTCIISSGLVFSPAFSEFRERLNEAGGKCEVVFGGMLIVHLPHETQFDLDQQLAQLPSIPNLSREELAQRYQEAGNTRQVSVTMPLRQENPTKSFAETCETMSHESPTNEPNRFTKMRKVQTFLAKFVAALYKRIQTLRS